MRSLEDIDFRLGGLDIAFGILVSEVDKLKAERLRVLAEIAGQGTPRVSDPDVTYRKTDTRCLCSYVNSDFVVNPKCPLRHKPSMECSVKECRYPSKIKGMCNRHYKTDWARRKARKVDKKFDISKRIK